MAMQQQPIARFDPNKPLDQFQQANALSMMGESAPLGATEEEIDRMRSLSDALRKQGQPGMHAAGRVSVAANPLEHLAWLSNQYNAKQMNDDAQGKRVQMGLDQREIVRRQVAQMRADMARQQQQPSMFNQPPQEQPQEWGY